jgi:hypothetical protein
MSYSKASFSEEFNEIRMRSRYATIIRIHNETTIADVFLEKDHTLSPHGSTASGQKTDRIFICQVHDCPLNPDSIISRWFREEALETTVEKVCCIMRTRKNFWLVIHEISPRGHDKMFCEKFKNVKVFIVIDL